MTLFPRKERQPPVQVPLVPSWVALLAQPVFGDERQRVIPFLLQLQKKHTGSYGNEPFGSRPEPGAKVLASILLLSPGEVPEGRAPGVQDTATQVQSESEC